MMIIIFFICFSEGAPPHALHLGAGRAWRLLILLEFKVKGNAWPVTDNPGVVIGADFKGIARFNCGFLPSRVFNYHST